MYPNHHQSPGQDAYTLQTKDKKSSPGSDQGCLCTGTGNESRGLGMMEVSEQMEEALTMEQEN